MIDYYKVNSSSFFEIKECHNRVHAEQEHFHEELSIAVIHKGQTTVQFEGRPYLFCAKDLIVIPPRLIHNCCPEVIEDWKFSMIYINYQWFMNSFKLMIDKHKLFHCSLADDEFQVLHQYIESLKKVDDKSFLESQLIELLDTFFVQKSNDFESVVIHSKEKQEIAIVKEYIEEHFADRLTLEDLVNISSLSKFHLLRVFKNIYKVSPLSYQRNLRFNFAKNELRKGKALADVAVALGYYDQSHFTNEFQKFTGTTPMEYRKNI
ncbi:AraC family transcriptional regulator [Desulfuribacillus alkaliarsenatis]|uniref:HTH araC/xylS-type domain-containing protein n=1 Tax=Desulfuribacillus alkaliarsenatis TaxID=766136 RepID=A0A1E5G1Z8_9FIRM|nr:AraC family transcriptional regulator [Desulfuribacillus alkaliarsenatis]OEF96996.1 hypothetical protein BHF68_05170 [Desulfuribacillus alkaliarsenatis]